MINVIIPSTPERKERLKTCIDSIEKTAGTEFKIKTYISKGEGWVKAVHKALKGVSGLCVIVGDDMTFGEDWLKILEKAYHDRFPQNDGLVQPFDEIHNGSLATCPMADAKTLRKYIHKGYIHNFADTELTIRLHNEGKYLYVPESIMIHHHPILGRVEIREANGQVLMNQLDETYKYAQKWYDVDEELFNKRNG